jgi:hypothetical protein
MKERRDLDGIYFRIKRDGEWQSICFSDLTKEEMEEILKDKDIDFLKRLAIQLGETIYETGDTGIFT